MNENNIIRILDSTVIGYYPNDAETIVNKLETLKGQDVNFEISNFGGDLSTALQVFRAIKKHEGKTTATYVGLNASAATLIATACDEVVADETAFILIHKVLHWIDLWGMKNADDLDGLIKQLSKVKDESEQMSLVCANIYARKTGKSREEVLELMSEDKFINAETALEFGLVDKIETYDSEINQTASMQMLRLKAQNAGLPNLPKRTKKETSKNKNTSKMNLVDKVLNLFKGKGFDTDNEEIKNELQTVINENQDKRFENMVTNEALNARLKDLPTMEKFNEVLETRLKDLATNEALNAKIEGLPTNEAITALESKVTVLETSKSELVEEIADLKTKNQQHQNRDNPHGGGDGGEEKNETVSNYMKKYIK